jgi:putative membrane protein
MYSRCIQGFGNGMMFGYRSGPFSGNWFVSMIIMVVLAVLIISAVILIIRKFTNLNKSHVNDAFLEELKTRFVKGEITEEEYMKKKNIINKLNS